MRIYRAVQTGPNTQLGGLKNGLLSVSYQLGKSLLVVKTEPNRPADRLRPTAMINFMTSGIFIFETAVFFSAHFGLSH